VDLGVVKSELDSKKNKKEDRSMKQLAQLKHMFDHFHEAIYIVNQHRKILYFNQAASQISGFSSGETEGFFCHDNILNHVDDQGINLCINGCPLVHSIETNTLSDHYVYLHHKLGHRLRVHVRVIPVIEDDEVIGAIEVFTDETQKNLLQQQLDIQQKLLMLDPLTGLFNRRFMDEKLGRIIEDKPEDQPFGFLFIDIDNFKDINDVFGHGYGDEVLKSISNTIQSNMKPTDYVIRYGGEEIVVIIPMADQQLTQEIAELIRILVRRTKPRDPKHDFDLTVSIGATVMSKHDTIESVIDRADSAMYQAKKSGKNKVVFLHSKH
jgi:diguanylate cyclase (GGDEF)-like protein/PAS domain S-box-containing protein